MIRANNRYRDYHHKVTTYVEILSREARRISPRATAQQWRVIADQDDTENVFLFADTASARQNTTDLARKLQHERIAIVGVGGTGSYILDLVAKTWAREIHLFDDDPFLQHNAFRSPGPFSRDELEGGPVKATFHAARYSRMRKGLIAHNTCIDGTNVEELGAFDTLNRWKVSGSHLAPLVVSWALAGAVKSMRIPTPATTAMRVRMLSLPFQMSVRIAPR